MKPIDVRTIERIASKKSMINMAIALLNEADTMICSKKVRDAVHLLEEAEYELDCELQDLMD